MIWDDFMHTLYGRVLHFTDLHFNPLNRIPTSRTPSYQADCEAELLAIRDLGNELNVTCYLFSGDLFNLKNSALYHPEHLLHYSQLLQSFGKPIYAIPGNHDLPHSSYEAYNKSAFKLIVESTPNFIDVSHRVLTQPITPTFSLSITGIPYYELEEFMAVAPTVNALLPATLDGTTMPVALIHTDITPNNDLPGHWQTINYPEVFKLFDRAKIICGGHIHHRYPLMQNTATGQILSKPFSIGRVFKNYYATLDDPNLRHEPEVSILEFGADEAGNFLMDARYQLIPCVPFDRAFTYDTLSQEIANSKTTSTFIDKIRQSFGSVDEAFTIQDPAAFLATQEMSDRVRATIDSYLANART